MAKQYSVAGRTFPTQAELEREVKEHLNSHDFNTVFGDQFLRAVVNSLHDEVRAAGQRVVLFEYLDWREQVRRALDTADRYRGGACLYGFFLPLEDWRDVTVYPWRKSKPEQDIKSALREKIASVLPRPHATDRCNREGCTARGHDLEYEHISPTFNEIAESCLALCTPEEISTRFGYSKFIPGRDHLVYCLPEDHPAVRRLFALHEHNEWEWLCALHHRGVRPTTPRLEVGAA